MPCAWGGSPPPAWGARRPPARGRLRTSQGPQAGRRPPPAASTRGVASAVRSGETRKIAPPETLQLLPFACWESCFVNAWDFRFLSNQKSASKALWVFVPETLPTSLGRRSPPRTVRCFYPQTEIIVAIGIRQAADYSGAGGRVRRLISFLSSFEGRICSAWNRRGSRPGVFWAVCQPQRGGDSRA